MMQKDTKQKDEEGDVKLKLNKGVELMLQRRGNRQKSLT